MKSLKADRLEKARLSSKEMTHLKGGARARDYCGCGCVYELVGGSSTASNASANSMDGLKSPEGHYKQVIYLIDPIVVTP